MHSLCLSLCYLVLTIHCGSLASAEQTKPDPQLKTPSCALNLPASVSLPTTLVIHLWNGIPVVQGVLDGLHFPSFVIDTALNACTITPDAAKSLTMTPIKNQLPVQVFDRKELVDQAKLTKLSFGHLNLTDVPVGIVDIYKLLSSTTTRPLDAPAGWIGSPFLAAFQVTFEFDRESMILEKPSSPLQLNKGAIVVPMELGEDGRVRVSVTVPGAKPFWAVLATSSPLTILPTELAIKAKLKPLDMASIIQANGSVGQVARVVLPRLAVGKAEVKDANAVYVASGSARGFDPQTGVLGMDFLRRFRVTLSYARHQVVFAPIPKGETEPDKKSQQKSNPGTNEVEN